MQPTIKRNPKAPRQAEPLLAPEQRLQGPEEVALGFLAEQVRVEALRCLQCKDPVCIDACPLHIDIKTFIARLTENDLFGAFQTISEQSPFPGICGRVCQHELFCEKSCLLGKKLDPVAIGSLERYVASEMSHQHREADYHLPPPNGLHVALVGSGPASLIAAFDLVRRGYKVTVFEALHQLGGVLAYGIPPFRLPREILDGEIDRLRRMGVEFRTGFIIGKTCTVDDLFRDGFHAVFIGTGAGLPHMMEIPGENLIGVYTANEFLTRLNLMEAFRGEEAHTPVRVGARTIVVGGGNSAMDAARWARRMGSQTTILFRRGHAELRARAEEVVHAEEEGVRFEFLAAPVRIVGNEKGEVAEVECIRMQLGEPDSSGRPSPLPMPGSEYRIPVDTVVMAIGQSPNPTVQRSTPQLLTKRGKIAIDESGKTSMEGVYAGGDVVRGGATVILAMKDGRAAATAIDRALRQQFGLPAAAGSDAALSANDAPSIPATGAGPSLARPISHRIVGRRMLTPEIVWLEVETPHIARVWKAGQFVILRPRPDSERIPVTIVGGDPARGTIILVVQVVGVTSAATAALQVGECLSDLLGPLGQPATVHNAGTVICAAGGVGVAELLPVARAFLDAGNHVVALCGARSKSHIILEDELQEAASEVDWGTDDGSFGFHGNVVQLMREWRNANLGKNGTGSASTGNGYGTRPPLGAAHVIGPIPMMRAAAELTREWGVTTFASLNPIMVDGTGMCGGCRVSVEGKARFACVDGPEFDAHQVDFDELIRRNRAYIEHERRSRERHQCLIGLDR